MRWFSINSHPLADALVAAGEEIVNTEGTHQVDAFPWLREAVDAVPDHAALWSVGDDPVTRALMASKDEAREALVTAYKLRRRLDALKPDVLVISPMYQPGFGVAIGHVVRWVQEVRQARRVAIGIINGATLQAAKNSRWRGCSANVHNLGGAIACSQEVAADSARTRRTALWVPGDDVAPVIEMVRHARSGKGYQAGSKAKPFI